MEAARAARAGRRENLSLKLAPRARRQKESFDAAFEGFYREHVAEVYQYALAVLGNSADAEDVTQQTFLNAYRAFQRGERPRKPHNWLIKIAHNVCRMRWRRSGRRPQEVPLDRAAEPAAPDKESESLEEVLTALARLPFNQRAAIVMREVERRAAARRTGRRLHPFALGRLQTGRPPQGAEGRLALRARSFRVGERNACRFARRFDGRFPGHEPGDRCRGRRRGVGTAAPGD